MSERSGVSTSAISNIETGKHGYQWDTLEDLAAALEAQPGEILSQLPPEAAAPATDPDDLADEIAELDAATRQHLRGLIAALAREPREP